MVKKIVSLTQQNQVSIPVSMIKEWGKRRPTKLVVVMIGDEVRMRPVKDFWSLGGSLKSEIKLTDTELRAARESFEKKWARKL